MNVTSIITNIGTNWEQIGATLVTAFTFVKAHGGLTTLWSDFRGPLAPVPSNIKANETITQVAAPVAETGQPPVAVKA
jgi:hypothetical protein